MKAIRVHAFGAPDVLKLEEIPDPAPGPGQVVIRAKAIGVNPVETYIRAGKYGPRAFPYIPGSDLGGVIESVGAGVTDWKRGDRVYTATTLSGAYAELALADASKIYHLPDKVTFAQGAALGVPAATAYKAAFLRGKALPAETVFIHGASGAVGLFCVQMLRAHGCTLIGTAGSKEGLDLIRREGVHHALDHTSADYLTHLMDLTGGKGVDLILEMLANVNLNNDLGVLARFGRVVIIGNRGRIEIDPRQAMTRDADIRGMTLMNATPEDLRLIHAAIGAMLESGILRPVIDSEIVLGEAARAHQEVLEGGSRGKIVLMP